MNLKIRMIDKIPKKRWDFVSVKGQIRIDEFVEDLYLPVDWWSPEEYEQQWREGLERLVNYDTSCLIVAINDPSSKRFIEWWPLYRVGDRIYIRNQIIFNDIYRQQIGDKPFNLQTCYDFVPQRSDLYDEDGNKISEWSVDWNGRFD